MNPLIESDICEDSNFLMLIISYLELLTFLFYS